MSLYNLYKTARREMDPAARAARIAKRVSAKQKDLSNFTDPTKRRVFSRLQNRQMDYAHQHLGKLKEQAQGISGMAQQAASAKKKLDSMPKPNLASSLGKGLAIGAGAGAATYVGKKLYDRYKAKKQSKQDISN